MHVGDSGFGNCRGGALRLLTLPRTRWHLAEIASAVLFGLSLQIKLISLIWLPLAALILWFRKMDESRSVDSAVLGFRVSAEPKGSHKTTGKETTGDFSTRFRSVIGGLILFGVVMGLVFVATDCFVDRGAYLAHFRRIVAFTFWWNQIFRLRFGI